MNAHFLGIVRAETDAAAVADEPLGRAYGVGDDVEAGVAAADGGAAADVANVAAGNRHSFYLAAVCLASRGSLFCRCCWPRFSWPYWLPFLLAVP